MYPSQATATRTAPSQDERVILGVLCFAAFLTANGLGSINIALPTIQREFNSSLAAIQWISMMGGVMLSTVSLCFGRAGDILGRRRLYRGGIVLYTLGSGLCALAASYPQLLVSRIIMTTGLAAVVPMAAAILASTFPAGHRGRALGLFVAASAAGRAAGPTIGGFVTYIWGWRAIFLSQLILGTLVCLAVFLVLRGEDERRAEPFDFVGAISLIVGYPSLLIALSLGADSNWHSLLVPVWLGLAAIALMTFIVAELHVPRPLVPLSLFTKLPFSAAVLSMAISSAIHSPLPIFAPLYMVNVLAFSAMVVGLVMTALPLSIVVASPISGWLADKVEARYIATLGLCLALIGIFLYSRLGVGSTYVWPALALTLVGIGVGVFSPANQTAAFAAVGKEYYGLVSAMLTSFGTAAGYLGVTVTVALVEGSLAGSTAHDPVGFTNAQHFAFTCLLPLAVIGVLVSVIGRPAKVVAPSPT